MPVVTMPWMKPRAVGTELGAQGSRRGLRIFRYRGHPGFVDQLANVRRDLKHLRGRAYRLPVALTQGYHERCYRCLLLRFAPQDRDDRSSGTPAATSMAAASTNSDVIVS